MENWSTSRGRPVQLKVAVAFSKIHARRKWNETVQMIFLFIIKHCCSVFSLAGSNDFWRFGLGLATFTQYQTAFRADTKKTSNSAEQNRTTTEQRHKSQGFQQEQVAGELNSPAISRKLTAYFSLEISPI